MANPKVIYQYYAIDNDMKICRYCQYSAWQNINVIHASTADYEVFRRPCLLTEKSGLLTCPHLQIPTSYASPLRLIYIKITFLEAHTLVSE